ncbi:type I 3-dehydroquinase-domain-containing protein [Penicillium herquei]|nr:type I 3-dehydroquinase-domain-containing protein [Penicillium herquei]
MAEVDFTSPPSSSSSPSIVLIGSRGCGKRTLAFIGALHLGRKLVLADRFFEEVNGLSRIDYLHKHGESALQQQTVRLVLKMLRENETGCIIECGMSSLNAMVQKFLANYKRNHPVIYIIRRFDEIKSLLQLDEADARRLKAVDSKQRSYSDFEFYNLEDPGSRSNSTISAPRPSPHHLKEAKLDFCHFLDLLICPRRSSIKTCMSPFEISSIAVDNRLYSYALTVKLSDLKSGTFDPAWLESGHDAIRLIVDLKENYSIDSITQYISLIRRIARIPIVYEVHGFAKAFSDITSTESEYLQLLAHGIRSCVDYLLVPLDLTDAFFLGIIAQKRRTKIIGCFHDPDPERHGWQTEARYEKYHQGGTLGCDLVQLTQAATTRTDNEELLAFIGSLPSRQEGHLRLIAYNTGSLGRSSLVLNKIMTPVRPAVSYPPSQDWYITAQQVMRGLFATFILDSLNFYHVGASVSWSPFPPAMHKAAYETLGLEHSYQVFETTTLQTLEELTRDPRFGGASISLPFKASILSSVDMRSPHATAIGAINTLLPLREPLKTDDSSLEYQASQRNRAGPVVGWYGDNTDWLGIFECVHRNLSPRNIIRPQKTTALVIGAGGAARAAIYALTQLGCRKILILNRTVQRAEKVAAHFNSRMNQINTPVFINVIQSIKDPWSTGLQPATIIVSCIPAHSIDGESPANLTLPESWLQSKSGGVVADVSEENPFI